MIFLDGELKVESKDFEKLKLLLNNILPVTDDMDFTELKIPLLMPFLEMVEEEGINISDVKRLSFGVDDTIIGAALLYHFREYEKFCKVEDERI